MAPNVLSTKRKALLSRAGWAALWGALSVLTVDGLDLPAQFVPVVAFALSAVKSYVAGRVGDEATVTFR